VYGYKGSYVLSRNIGSLDFTTTLGVDFRNDQVNSVGLAHTERRQFLNDVKKGAVFQTNAAAYAEESVRISARLTASFGARFDVFRFRYDNALIDTVKKSVVKGIVSPKLNLYYSLTPKTQVYFSAGTGFHSNDARVATVVPSSRTVPRATGADLGLNLKVSDKLFVNSALWVLDLENEFVYVGDEGIVEVSGYSHRVGMDLSARYQLTQWLFADFDLTLAIPRLINNPEGSQNIPLAPCITSIGGLSVKMGNGINGSLRYRYMGDRPANEDNSIVAKGYYVMDAVINYTTNKYVFAISAENMLNTKWKEAQFATESRLKNEAAPVEEIHFTPGTPLFMKASATYNF
jgi:outer membrane receptor protein involved in Fe transport